MITRKYFEEWNGKKFPVRMIPFNQNGAGIVPKVVADYELWAAIESAYDNEDAEKHSEAVAIDNEIFYYCNSGFIASDPSDEEIIEYLTKDDSL